MTEKLCVLCWACWLSYAVGAAGTASADAGWQPHVVLISFEDEYHTSETLPRFAEQLQRLCERFDLVLAPHAGIIVWVFLD